MKKGRPVVKSKLSKLHKWLDDHIPKPTKNAVDKAFLKLKNNILRLYDGAKKTLKDIVEKEGQEVQQQEEDLDLTLHKNEKALKGSYRRFVILVHLKQILIVTLIKPSHTSRRKSKIN